MPELFYVIEKKGRDHAKEQRLAVIFRKILVLLISLIELNKEFINFKTHTQFFKIFSISPETRQEYRSALAKRSSNQPMPKLKICPSLMSLKLEQLVKMIDIDDLQFYQWMNRVYLDKKRNSRWLTYNDMFGKQARFDLTFEEKQAVICSRTKRKDEILKFSFKFLRKRLLLKYRRDNKMMGQNQLKLKSVFNKQVLKEDQAIIKHFYSYDVSKKNLQALKKDQNISGYLIRHFYEHFICDSIENILSFKQEEILKREMPPEKFLETMFSSQQKKSLVLQDVFNIFQIFHEYFCVSK